MYPFSVILYTNNKYPEKVFNAALYSIRSQIEPEQLVIVGHKLVDHPLTKGCRQMVYKPTGKYNLDIYSQIMMGIEISQGEIVMCMEHDVLYPHTYLLECMDNHKAGRVNYANQIWMLNALGYWSYAPATFQSTCYGERQVMLDAIHRKMSYTMHDFSTNPDTLDLGTGSNDQHYEFANLNPVLDIRHNLNVSPTGTMRKQQNIHSTIPYWGQAKYMIQQLQLTETHGLIHSENPKES